ncbi:hypothetical protein G7051_17360 [Dysgonomonas sp. HDW5B]|uniref:hypothetical protein n=1 Tax=Dysgonomonas sp. HDW5B TaxID=2714927 RepID=UPI0014077C38|nr:hypothetical protein [Dysgonomonas sp. HDW5B]QIK56029.1 hypothetical protein G7051_17360 [Dysgonomonas sp. HDW5B]
MKKLLLLALVIVSTSVAIAQTEPAYKKGKFYAFWGWNRAHYTNSTIHFTGDDYDFTLHRVVAHDKLSAVNYHNYLQPNRITIPQTNFKIGYFFKDNMAVNIGVDHMKYVMDQNQTVSISGTVRPGFEDHVTPNGDVRLTEDFLMFEHTDGLNYINSEFEYYHNFYKRGILKINGIAGVGAGFLLPKTNSTLFSEERHDDFHLAGFGLNGKIAADVLLWDLFFLRCEGKQGYINMPSIRTTASSSDKASQHFWFAQVNFLFGFAWSF